MAFWSKEEIKIAGNEKGATGGAAEIARVYGFGESVVKAVESISKGTKQCL